MASTSLTEALEGWFRHNSGYLDDGVRISHNNRMGMHFKAIASIQPGITIAAAPHSITLSYLNALVDDAFPVFRQQRHQFKVEAIGFFYLMVQYVDRARSFWKPYLDALPDPTQDFSQPVFFEAAEDVAWLEGTDVWHTITARKEVHKKYYEDGITVLKNAGMDVTPYTWHLFKWSTTMFASRSFTSLALLSMGSKYRTAYKSRPDGLRQAVLLDMSGALAEDLDFPVLFPGLDVGNHDHSARIDWTFDPGRFSVSNKDQIEAGAEVFNNYGPKGNGELLIGYGFCIPDNPYDTVALTLKEPPLDLQVELKNGQSGYFTTEGDWSLEKATFRLTFPSLRVSHPRQIFYQLAEPLLEMLLYILRHERNLPFAFISQPLDELTSRDAPRSRYLPHIARMIVQFLSQKLSQLQSTHLPSAPQNNKQMQASIYRQGQINIMQYIISGLRTYTRSLIWTPFGENPQLPAGPCLMSLESLIQILTNTGGLDAAFLEGIEASANTKDIEQLRLAGWEDDVYVLLLCYLFLQPEKHEAWLRDAIPEYINLSQPLRGSTATLDSEDLAQADSLFDIVSAAAEACPGSLWEDKRWSAEYITSVGGRFFQHESFMVMCPTTGGGEEARLCVYFHANF